MTWTFGPGDLGWRKLFCATLSVLPVFTNLKIIQKLQPKFKGKQKLLSI